MQQPSNWQVFWAFPRQVSESKVVPPLQFLKVLSVSPLSSVQTLVVWCSVIGWTTQFPRGFFSYEFRIPGSLSPNQQDYMGMSQGFWNTARFISLSYQEPWATKPHIFPPSYSSLARYLGPKLQLYVCMYGCTWWMYVCRSTCINIPV